MLSISRRIDDSGTIFEFLILDL